MSMTRFTYTNERGQSVTLGNSAPFVVTKVDGLGSPQNEIHSQKSPYQDGVTVVNSTLAEQVLAIEGVILGPEREMYRRKLLQAFNPKLDGVLRYESGQISREIACVPELAPSFPGEHGKSYQVFLINLICPNPFWQDINTTKEEIAIWRGSFELPMELLEEGIEMGYREPSLIVNVFNSGDVPCGMKIQFKALATVVNPSLFNVNTREYFKINRTMEAGEVITVTTHFQKKRVELNKNGVVSNAFNWIDFQSTFLQLDVGDNLLRYDASSGLDNLEVSIYHTPMYLGV